jgi:hypothetical protein
LAERRAQRPDGVGIGGGIGSAGGDVEHANGLAGGGHEKFVLGFVGGLEVIQLSAGGGGAGEGRGWGFGIDLSGGAVGDAGGFAAVGCLGEPVIQIAAGGDGLNFQRLIRRCAVLAPDDVGDVIVFDEDGDVGGVIAAGQGRDSDGGNGGGDGLGEGGRTECQRGCCQKITNPPLDQHFITGV